MASLTGELQRREAAAHREVDELISPLATQRVSHAR
jgi:hypothetical protein